MTLSQGSYGHSHDDGEVLHAVGESCGVQGHDPLACTVRAYATTLLLARRLHPPFDTRHTNPFRDGTGKTCDGVPQRSHVLLGAGSTLGLHNRCHNRAKHCGTLHGHILGHLELQQMTLGAFVQDLGHLRTNSRVI